MAVKRSAGADNASMRAVLEEWLSAQPSTNTRAAYRSDLETFGRWCASTGEIALTADTETMIAFQIARETAGDSDPTMRRRWSALSSFYDFALLSGRTAANPVRAVDRPKVEAGDPSSTVQLSAQAVDSYQTMAAALDPRLDALVALLVTDGLKVGEALALDVADIAHRSGRTSISIRRRGEVTRIVVSAHTAKALRRCVGNRHHGPVFINVRSRTAASPQRLTRFGADHLIRQLRSGDEAGQVTANALRRFHFAHNEANGAALDDVRKSGGLADIRSVRRYTASNPPTTQASREPGDDARPSAQRTAAQSRRPTSPRSKK